MLTRLFRCTAFACVGFALGCGSSSDGDLQPPYSAESRPDSVMQSNPDCAGTPPAFAQVAAFKVCVMCHASTKGVTQRSSAPIDVNFDTERDADAHADRAVMLVMSGLMPPRASGLMLTDADKQQLYAWVMCRM